MLRGDFPDIMRNQSLSLPDLRKNLLDIRRKRKFGRPPPFPKNYT